MLHCVGVTRAFGKFPTALCIARRNVAVVIEIVCFSHAVAFDLRFPVDVFYLYFGYGISVTVACYGLIRKHGE